MSLGISSSHRTYPQTADWSTLASTPVPLPSSLAETKQPDPSEPLPAVAPETAEWLQAQQYSIRFDRHEDGETTVVIMNNEGEVVRSVPAQELLRLMQREYLPDGQGVDVRV